MATNPFADFISGEALGSQPRLAYQAMMGDPNRTIKPWEDEGQARQEMMFGNPYASRRYFQGQFQNIYNDFLGAQGRALQGGQLPSQTFTQFLEQYPFTQRYAALPPELAGRSLGSFAPRVQYSYL
jgi:hypothetical protein